MVLTENAGHRLQELAKKGKRLTAVRVNVAGCVYLTSLEALRSGARKGTQSNSDVLERLADEAEEFPGRELMLDRPADSQCTCLCHSVTMSQLCPQRDRSRRFLSRHLNMPNSKLSAVTDIGILCREARFLGLEEIAHKATSGNHLGWRSQDTSLFNAHSAPSLQGRRSSVTSVSSMTDAMTSGTSEEGASPRIQKQCQGMGGSFRGSVSLTYFGDATPRRMSVEGGAATGRRRSVASMGSGGGSPGGAASPPRAAAPGSGGSPLSAAARTQRRASMSSVASSQAMQVHATMALSRQLSSRVSKGMEG